MAFKVAVRQLATAFFMSGDSSSGLLQIVLVDRFVNPGRTSYQTPYQLRIIACFTGGQARHYP